MIIKNGKTISARYKGTKEIIKRYKGTLVVYESFKTLIASGVPPLTIFSKGEDLINYKIYGNSIQNGTPTPDAPIEIESVGEKTNNLINIKNVNNSNCKVNGNELKVTIYSGNSSQSTGATLKQLCPDIEVGKTYELIFNTEDANVNFSIGTYSATNFWANGEKRTITETDLTTVVRIGGGTTTTGRTLTLSNIRIIEEGVSSTGYEPYGYRIPVKSNDITTNIYLDKPLGKTDDVAEYIDFQNKEIKSQIKEVIFNGSENWALNTALVDKGVHRFHITISDAYYSSAVSTNNQCKCSHFDTSSNMANANSQGIKNGVYVYTRIAYFYTDATMFPDLETWKEWLSNNNVKFQYKLAEEKSTPIELPNIPTIKGTTIIEVDTEVQPSNMEVTYKGKN